MRAAIALLIVIAATVSARADVEDRDPIPPARRAVAVGIMGHSGRYLGQSESGWGPFLELAAGRGRWQYFAELGGMRITLGKDDLRTGFEVRGGAGVRWLARSFVIASSGSIDMNLEAFAGVGQLRWDHAERVLRPDLGAGVSYQYRMFRPWKVTLRVSARVYFAPHDHSAAPSAVCRGSVCSTDQDTASSSGLIALYGLAW